MDENLTLPTMLERTAEKFGARAAMVFNERTVTYSDLAEDVRALSGAFAARGIAKGDCVAIVHRNAPEFVAAYFALNRLGAVAVPVNFMVSKADELAFMLNDCKAVGVVTQKEFAQNVAGARALVPTIKTVWTSDVDAPAAGCEDLRALRKENKPAPAPAPVPQDVACILYTSGTTGRPKGVMLTHRNLVSNASDSGKSLELSHKDVFLCILPMFHTFAWTACVCIPILNGSKIVVVASITPPKPWLELMAKHKVTLFAAVPQLYSALAKQAKGFKGLVLRYWFFRKVRFGVSGAAPLSLDTLRSFESRIGVPILEGFGMTETSPVATVNTQELRKPGSVGRPIENVLVRIVDEDEKPLGQGQEGEVCVKGPNVMKGYFNNPEATAAAFTKDGWLKTGDIGVVDSEGYLTIRDRKKDMIIVKGLKVFPAMLEAEIVAFPGVEEAAVVGVPTDDGDEIIKLFLVAKKGETVEKSAMQKFLKEKFDPYKRPRDIEIVESLPKNALQKVLKHVLRKQELERLKAASNSTSAGAHPRNA